MSDLFVHIFCHKLDPSKKGLRGVKTQESPSIQPQVVARGVTMVALSAKDQRPSAFAGPPETFY